MNKLTEGYTQCQSPSSGVISEAFGEWLDNMASWDWYATLTFRDPQSPIITRHTLDGILCPGRSYQVEKFPGWSRAGWKYARNALNNLNSSLINFPDGSNPTWVACMELQQRGVPHWHGLFANMGDTRRMDWVDWWYEHYGIARILPYERQLGARYYLGKYLSKQVADIRVSPALAVQLRRQNQGKLAMVSP